MSYEPRNGKVVEQYSNEEGTWYYILLTVNAEGKSTELTKIKLDNPPEFIGEYEEREASILAKEEEFQNSLTKDYVCPPPTEVLKARDKRRSTLKTSNKAKQEFLDALNLAKDEDEMLGVFRAYGLEVEV
jgi:hypothetical protein